MKSIFKVLIPVFSVKFIREILVLLVSNNASFQEKYSDIPELTFLYSSRADENSSFVYGSLIAIFGIPSVVFPIITTPFIYSGIFPER
jgi:hypothetical protein